MNRTGRNARSRWLALAGWLLILPPRLAAGEPPMVRGEINWPQLAGETSPPDADANERPPAARKNDAEKPEPPPLVPAPEELTERSAAESAAPAEVLTGELALAAPAAVAEPPTAPALAGPADCPAGEGEIVSSVLVPPAGGRLMAQPRSAPPPSPLLAEVLERCGQIRADHAPEAVARYSIKRGVQDRTVTQTLAGGGALPGPWTLAAAAERQAFFVEGKTAPDQDADLRLIRLRLTRVFSPRLSAWGEAEPYEADSVSGLALAGGLEWRPHERLNLRGEADFGRPWADSAAGVEYAVREHGLTAAANLSLSRRLTLTLDGAWHGYDYATEAGGGDGRNWGGTEWEAGARVDLALMGRPDLSMGGGFLDSAGLPEGPIDCGLGLFAAWRREQYEVDEEFVAVAPESASERVGVTWRRAVNRHFGLNLEGYFGGDDRREIAWGNLYGWRGRLVFAPSRRLRFWTGYQMDSEATTAGGGRTNLLELGMNANF